LRRDELEDGCLPLPFVRHPVPQLTLRPVTVYLSYMHIARVPSPRPTTPRPFAAEVRAVREGVH
jgi:hypothetical protein